MSTKDAKDILDLNEAITETSPEEKTDGYETIENAFSRMKEIQKQMTMQKIFEMEKSLNKLEKELNKIIKTNLGE